MMHAYNRGHEIVWLDPLGWVYADNHVQIDKENRPCVRCGKLPTVEGYDACLGFIDGAMSACCGHGVSEPITE
jgi:hypothetical protein